MPDRRDHTTSNLFWVGYDWELVSPLMRHLVTNVTKAGARSPDVGHRRGPDRGGGQAPLFRHGKWELLRSMTVQELRSRYRQTALALLWTLLQPLLLVAVYAIFFKGILNVSGGSVPYLSFILAGLVPWRFVVGAMGATSALTDNVQIISKVYFPRELVPLSNTAVGLVDLAIGTVILLIVTTAQGYVPDMHLLAPARVPARGPGPHGEAAIVATTIAVFVRDVSHGMPMLLQLVFFASPIMYPSDQLPSWLSWLTAVNPITVVVNSHREVLFEHAWPNWTLLGAHLGDRRRAAGRLHRLRPFRRAPARRCGLGGCDDAGDRQLRGSDQAVLPGSRTLELPRRVAGPPR